MDDNPQHLYNNGMTIREIAAATGTSRSTIHRTLTRQHTNFRLPEPQAGKATPPRQPDPPELVTQINAAYKSGMTIREVATATDLSYDATRNIMHRHNIPTRTPKQQTHPAAHPPTLITKAVQHYLDGMTIRETATATGLGKNAVHKILARNNISRRTPGRRQQPSTES